MPGFLSTYVVAFLGWCALACGVATADAARQVSVGGVIAFTSNRDGDTEIYVMNPNGTGVRRLTHSPKFDSSLRMVARRPQAPLLQSTLPPATSG